MLRLTSRASELFLEQPPAEQRCLLQTMIETASWKNGELRMTLFEPFEIPVADAVAMIRATSPEIGHGLRVRFRRFDGDAGQTEAQSRFDPDKA